MSERLFTEEDEKFMQDLARLAALAVMIVTWALAFLTVTAFVFWIVILKAAFSG